VRISPLAGEYKSKRRAGLLDEASQAGLLCEARPTVQAGTQKYKNKDQSTRAKIKVQAKNREIDC
jgi:hypothetical protein